jgi:hypothetical protein
MNVAIPFELAKRVLKELAAAADDADREVQSEYRIGGPDHPRTLHAKREAAKADALRDELAALLNPKEAT